MPRSDQSEPDARRRARRLLEQRGLAGWESKLPAWEAGETARHPPGVQRDRQRRRSTSCPGWSCGGADLTGNTGTELKDAPVIDVHRLRRSPDPLRHPRARHGLGHERHGGAAASCPSAAPSSCSATTCAAAVRLAALSGYKIVVRLDPRLGRARRGRPDPPADRAARGAAGDARAARHPSGRRQRDRAGVADPRRRRGPDRAHPHPPEAPGAGGHGRARTRRRAPRGLRPRRRDRRRPRPRADRHRLRGLGVRRARRAPRRRLSVRVVSMPSWDLFAAQSDDYREQVLPADVPTLAVEAGGHLRVGALRRRRRRHRPLRRLGARPGGPGEVRLHRRERRRRVPRALLDEPSRRRR